MKLHINQVVKKIIENDDTKEYKLITNINEEKLDAVKLCILFLNLKNSSIITNAYDIWGNELHHMYGVYIDILIYETQDMIFDKFINTLSIIQEELEIQRKKE